MGEWFFEIVEYQLLLSVIQVKMPNVIRIALPTYNALTDTNPDHFALYTDEDWVLIKEFARGSVASGSTVYHNLGYVPTVLAYAIDASGRGHWAYGETMYAEYRMKIYTDRVTFSSDGSATFKYYIFYDAV